MGRAYQIIQYIQQLAMLYTLYYDLAIEFLIRCVYTKHTPNQPHQVVAIVACYEYKCI